MPRKLHILTRTGFLVGLFAAFAAAQNHYILNAPAGNIDDLCKRNGLQLVSALPGSAHGLFVVNSPLPPLPHSLTRYETLLHKLAAKNRTERFTQAEEIIAAIAELRSAMALDIESAVA